MKHEEFKKRLLEGRQIEYLQPGKSTTLEDTGDEKFNLIKLLQGTWSSPEQGWNLIALPFRDKSAPFNYRVMMNQYGETLHFKTADKSVPNRGITPDEEGVNDQLLDALDYEQMITQVEVDDFPKSDLRAPNDKGIHHEPGLFLQILNHITSVGNVELRVARLGTIPHGNSVLALGSVDVFDGPPTIPDLNALPIGVSQGLDSPYLGPYAHYEEHPFFGTVDPAQVAGFPGFFASNANAILQFVPLNDVKETTVLHFDTRFGTGGIVNIPFIEREADPTEMQATFWIMEMNDGRFMMQYTQTVMLDFFERPDGLGLIKWPHVSINTLMKE